MGNTESRSSSDSDPSQEGAAAAGGSGHGRDSKDILHGRVSRGSVGNRKSSAEAKGRMGGGAQNRLDSQF